MPLRSFGFRGIFVLVVLSGYENRFMTMSVESKGNNSELYQEVSSVW
jgi:hypothetical protein